MVDSAVVSMLELLRGLIVFAVLATVAFHFLLRRRKKTVRRAAFDIGSGASKVLVADVDPKTGALVGKPHAAIYERALGALERAGVDRARVAAVGDSMHHDVAGAAAAGVDSVLVAGGVHAAELGVAQGAHEAVDADRLAAFLADFDAQPTHVVPGFTL